MNHIYLDRIVLFSRENHAGFGFFPLVNMSRYWPQLKTPFLSSSDQ